MTDYTKLVEALRYCAESGDFKCGKDCPMHTEYPNCLTKMDTDAAAAIEELQAQLPKLGEWEQVEVIGYDGNSMNDDAAQCSVCGHDEQDIYWARTYYHYCPNCGAKMEVQDAD